MHFKPLNEKELQELSLVEEGNYKFRVLRADHKTSKSGNDYFNLKLAISVNGRDRIIYDTLLFDGKMMYKTRHFCYGTGLESKYEDGQLLPVDCDGVEGELFLIKNVNKLTGELQNSVKDYIYNDVNIEAQSASPYFDDMPSFNL